MSEQSYHYVERFFASAFELTSILEIERRDGQSLFTFLEAMHSLADKIRASLGVDLQDVPEFILLRIVRNYLHHAGDLQEFMLFVRPHEDFVPTSLQQILIPASQMAAAIKSFRDRENKAKRGERAEANLRRILDFADIEPLISQTDIFLPKAQLKLDGRVYDLAVDLFKAIYNITNIIADHCRAIDDLKGLKAVAALDPSVTRKNNIPKFCLAVRPGVNLFLTTEGQIAAETYERVSGT